MLKVIFLFFFIASQFHNRIHASETIPFTLAGNLILISTTVDDQAGTYILDTGTPVVILNKKYFEGRNSDKVMHGISGEAGEVTTRYSDIEIGQHRWNGVYAEITSLDALEAALRQPIHGLLGCQLFRKHIVEFDYKNERITISAAENQDYYQPPDSYGSLTNTYKYKGKIPVINANIGSIILKLVVDTGSAYNIFSKKDLDHLHSNTIEWDQQRLVGLGNGELQVQAGTVFDLQVGDKICEPMKTLFSDNSRMQMLCPGQAVDGILGYEFLKQLIMIIDFKSNIVSFREINESAAHELANKR